MGDKLSLIDGDIRVLIEAVRTGRYEPTRTLRILFVSGTMFSFIVDKSSEKLQRSLGFTMVFV